MTVRRALIAAFASVLALATSAAAQIGITRIQPISISELVRMLDDEAGATPVDWDAFEAAHKAYVERHQPLQARAKAMSVASVRDQDAQRVAAIELRLAQQDLDAGLFAAITPTLGALDQDALQAMLIRREVAESERMLRWLFGGRRLNGAEELARVLKDDPALWLELKPEVDRRRSAARDLWRRAMRQVGDAMACAQDSAESSAAAWEEYRAAAEELRQAEEAILEAKGEGADAPPLAAEGADTAEQLQDKIAENERRMQQGMERSRQLHNACWAPLSESIAALLAQQHGLYEAVRPRLSGTHVMRLRRAIARTLGVPTDRDQGVEQVAVESLRLPGLAPEVADRIKRALFEWSEQDAKLQDELFTKMRRGERSRDMLWRAEGEESADDLAAQDLAQRREACAEAGRAAIAALALDGATAEQREALNARQLERQEAVKEAVRRGTEVPQEELLLGPDDAQPEEQLFEVVDGMEAIVGPRKAPSAERMEECIRIFQMPPDQAEAMRALLAAHEARIDQIRNGDVASAQGDWQNEAIHKAMTQPLAEAIATVDELSARRRTLANEVHAADDEYWRALAALAGGRGGELSALLQVSAVLTSRSGEWRSAGNPGDPDPVAAALACARTRCDLPAVLAACAAAEPAASAVLLELRRLHMDEGDESLRGSVYWRRDGAVTDDDRAAYHAERVERAEASEKRARSAAHAKRDAIKSLITDLAPALGTDGAWRLRRAMAAQAAPDAFREAHRIVPILDSVLASADLPGELRVEVLSLKDDFEPQIRAAESDLIDALDQLAAYRLTAGDDGWGEWQAQWLGVTSAWWYRDEVERRCAERLRRLVPKERVGDGLLRRIRTVEPGRYGD